MKIPLIKEALLARHQPDNEILLTLAITAAKTVSWIGIKPEIITGFDTGDFTQAAIDALLNSTNEVLAATAFGSTAMGTDAFGFVLNCLGQVRAVRSMTVATNIGVGGATVSCVCAGQTSALPNTLPALARVQTTSGGNIAAQFVITGLDAATSGLLQIRLITELV